MAVYQFFRLLLSLAYLCHLTYSTATQTIASLGSYQQQRSCALRCFWGGDPDNGYGTDQLGLKLGCCENQVNCEGHAPDSCFCRSDLRPAAMSWFSTCVNNYCSSNPVDLSGATSVYDEYCGPKRAAASPASSTTDVETATVAETTGAAPSQTSGTDSPPQVTVTVSKSLQTPGAESTGQATVTVTTSSKAGTSYRMPQLLLTCVIVSWRMLYRKLSKANLLQPVIPTLLLTLLLQ
jgi:hypothetical protein